jgi:outer membrane protein OmpA-like peptidoglycan-associated protein
LLFESGSATLKPESQEQLRNIAEILKAYPNVKVKIGGYTDNVGDPAFNMKLSQDRATNVMNELVILGVASNRLEAEGYGEKHPVANNSTEEGRAKNRRISLQVNSK